MKVTFRLPSKKIQYGYAEVELDLDGKTAAEIGDVYATYTLNFQSGEIDGFDAYKDRMTATGKPIPDPQEEFIAKLDAKVVSVEETQSATEADDVPPWKKAADVAEKPWDGPQVQVSLL